MSVPPQVQKATPLPGTTIAQYASNAGFTGEDLLTAVAIAYAESSGIETAYNPESAFFVRKGIDPEQAEGMGSVGLWQIFVWMHPELKGWNLGDGQMNAHAARLVWEKAGHSFRPWATFPDAYKKHLAQAQADVQSLTA